ncbi:MAG: cytochrome c oxidase assembly protein [Gemmatimonadales bacterium]|nr:cytochrome c oxidase assembly protein [Gemmatimonadales bacterium]
MTQWWCAATGAPWTWAWQAYPGIWLFVLLVAAFGILAERRHRAAGAAPATGRVGWYAGGTLTVWLALDWPIGPLGAGYLVSAHTLTYILLTMLAAPCLILGARHWGTPGSPVRRLAAHPLLGALVYHLALFATHIPSISDRALRSPVGSALVDTVWLVGGLALWWPVVARREDRRLSRPLSMLYLFAMTLLPTIPAAVLTFADFPKYTLFEFAPRVFPILDAATDQQLAGLLMKLAADPFLIAGIGMAYLKWQREERAA